MIAWILCRPNTKGSAGEKAASVTAGAIPMTRFRRTKEGGESEAAEAKSLNTELQDSGAEVRSSEVEASEKEVVCHPELARLSSEH